MTDPARARGAFGAGRARAGRRPRAPARRTSYAVHVRCWREAGGRRRADRRRRGPRDRRRTGRLLSGRRRGSAAPHVDVGLDRRAAAAPADAGVDQDAAAQLDEARACLDRRRSLRPRAFLAAPAPRPSHLLADVEACRRSTCVTLWASLLRAAAAYPRQRSRLRACTCGASSRTTCRAGSRGAGAGGDARVRARDAVAAARRSRLLRRGAAPTAPRGTRRAQRAARDGRLDQAVVVAFGDATAVVLDLAAADKPDAAALSPWRSPSVARAPRGQASTRPATWAS